MQQNSLLQLNYPNIYTKIRFWIYYLTILLIIFRCVLVYCIFFILFISHIVFYIVLYFILYILHIVYFTYYIFAYYIFITIWWWRRQGQVKKNYVDSFSDDVDDDQWRRQSMMTTTMTRFYDDEMTIWSLFHWFFFSCHGPTDGQTVMTTTTMTTTTRWRRQWRQWRRWRRWQYQLWWRLRRSFMAIRSKFPSFSLVVTDGRMDGWTDGQTKQLIEMQGSI